MPGTGPPVVETLPKWISLAETPGSELGVPAAQVAPPPLAAGVAAPALDVAPVGVAPLLVAAPPLVVPPPVAAPVVAPAPAEGVPPPVAAPADSVLLAAPAPTPP